LEQSSPNSFLTYWVGKGVGSVVGGGVGGGIGGLITKQTRKNNKGETSLANYVFDSE
jgi:hypothetical protein